MGGAARRAPTESLPGVLHRADNVNGYELHSPGPGFLSDCSDSASLGDTRGLFYSSWAAAQAAGIANAVASSLPDEVSYTPGLIVAGVAFGVANGLAIGLQDRLDRKLDCATAEFNATLISAYPVQGTDDPSPGDYTRASSQASVDRLALPPGVSTRR